MALRITGRSSHLVLAHVALVSLAAGTDRPMESDSSYTTQDCKESVIAQVRQVEIAKADLHLIETGIENRMTDMSQLEKVVTQLDKVLANDVADIKAASTIRGMETIQYRIQRANSSAAQEKLFQSLGVDDERKEVASRKEYEKLLLELKASSARAVHTRDDNLEQIGMLLQGADALSTASGALANHSQEVAKLRQSNTELERVLADNNADTKAASAVRGMELAAFNYHQKLLLAKPVDKIGRTQDEEAVSRKDYEEFLRKLDAEVAKVNRDRDHALETHGDMLRKFKHLDSRLAQVTAFLAEEQQQLAKLQASCLKPSEVFV